MRIRSIARAFLTLSFVLLVQQAFCWGLTGHRIIGEIAQQHLSKKARKEIKKLIGKETLAWWANWPDFIKSDSTWNHASPWHYVNIESGLSKEEFLNTMKAQQGKTLYTQILTMMGELKDRSLPIGQRRQALYFLVHLIGDLHQPLHVGHAEDLGGNKVIVYWFDKKTNLHSLWDSGLIDFQEYSYSEYAKLLDIASDEQVKAWQATSLEDIFYETYKLAELVYASAKNEDKLSYRYNFQFQKMLDEQLLKGGIRLAAFLNEALR